MGFQKFGTISYCVGDTHRTATTNIFGDITSSASKVSIGHRSICKRKKSMIDSDNTETAEGLSDFFKNLGKKDLLFQKELAEKVFERPLASLVD